MSGKQITIFLAPSDQASFETSLRTVGEMVVLKSRAHSPTPELQQTTVIAEYGKEPLRVLLARPDDLGTIRFEPVRGRQEYTCNPTFESIVEFDRSYVADDFIRAGRLYYVPKYYDESGVLCSKSEGFLEWADRLLRAARDSTREIGPGVYAGPGAVELSAASKGRLEGI